MIMLVGPHHSFIIDTYVLLFLFLSFFFFFFSPVGLWGRGWNLDFDLNLVYCPDDGTYTMKKVMIQNTKQLELVREEIRVSSLFSHPNLLPLLGHAIISVKVISQSGYSYLIYNCYSYIFLNIKLDTYRIVTWLLLWLDYFSIKLMVSNHSFGFDFGH